MPNSRRARSVLCTVYSSEFCTVGVPSERETGADNVASTFIVSCVRVEVRLQDDKESK